MGLMWRQRNKLKGLLKDKKTESRVIVGLHHHPFSLPLKGRFPPIIDRIFHSLKDGEAFLNVVQGKVDMILFGHQHLHIDLSNGPVSQAMNVPFIYANGSSTQEGRDMYLDKEGRIIYFEQGFLGRDIHISPNGTVKSETIFFPSSATGAIV